MIWLDFMLYAIHFSCHFVDYLVCGFFILLWHWIRSRRC